MSDPFFSGMLAISLLLGGSNEQSQTHYTYRQTPMFKTHNIFVAVSYGFVGRTRSADLSIISNFDLLLSLTYDGTVEGYAITWSGCKQKLIMQACEGLRPNIMAAGLSLHIPPDDSPSVDGVYGRFMYLSVIKDFGEETDHD